MPIRDVTHFQNAVRSKLQRLVESHGMRLSLSEDGQHEIFLFGVIEPAGVKVWLYEDELEFDGSGKYRMLERQDFDDLDSMERYYLDELDALLSAADEDVHDSPSSE